MNQFEKRSKASYDRKSDHYEATFDGKFTVKFKELLYRAVRIQPNDTVADIACGNGRMLHHLAETVQFTGCGVDISDKMIEQAQQLNPNMKFFVAGCDRLPFADGTIDVMTVCAAFHHFPYPEKFAEEAARVLKKDGMLYIAEVYLPPVFRVLCNPFLKFSRAGDVKFYGPEEIVSLFEPTGFTKRGVEIANGVQLVQLQRK